MWKGARRFGTIHKIQIMRHMRVHLVSFNSIYYVHTFYEDPSYIVLPSGVVVDIINGFNIFTLQKIFPHQPCVF